MTFDQTKNIIYARAPVRREEFSEELGATVIRKSGMMLRFQIWDQVRDHICFPVKAVVCHQTSRFYE